MELNVQKINKFFVINKTDIEKVNENNYSRNTLIGWKQRI